MDSLSRERRATLSGLGAVGLWSTVATAFELALQGLSPLELITLAATVSFVLYTVVLVLRRQLGSALRIGWGAGLLFGALNPTAYYLVLFFAYERLPGQEAMALNYSWALVLALLAVPILGQPLRRRDVLGSALAYAGVWTIATRGAVFRLEFADGMGVAAALASTVLWALSWIFAKRDRRPPLVAQWQNFGIGSLLLLGALTLGPGLRVPDPRSLAAGVYVGLFEMGFAFLLWQQALRTTERAARIANLIFLSPPVSLLLLHFVAGETLLPSTLPGLALILAGIAVQRIARRA